MNPHPEWVRFAAMQYIRAMSDYRAAHEADLGALEELRTKAEALGAIRYDREGSPAGWRDRLPEIIDTMDAIRDRIAGRIQQSEREYQDALELFNGDIRARMAWEKYGLRHTWAEVSKEERWSKATCRRWAADGLAIIYEGMPPEYRRVHVQAEEWDQGEAWRSR